MRRTAVTAIVLGLVAGSLAAPGRAGGKKNVTLYLHGREVVGEFELPETWLNANPMTMDGTKPKGQTRSRFATNYVVGPNGECSGNGLYPLWRGELRGTVTGNIKITVHTVATPAAKLVLELFPDATGGCNSAVSEDYIPPAASKTMDVPPGPGKVVAVIKNAKFKVAASLWLQVRIADQGTSPAQVRLLYDSPEAPSAIKLSVAR
ncbi:MAG: hypothetical protein ACRDJJ_03110 [Actinomycetota bacterium]